MDEVYQKALALHQQHGGKLGVSPLVTVANQDDLSLVYTPGVAEPSRVIAADPTRSFDLTMRGRTVAVISDGSAVLGLGNIGPEAAMPVMEGKAALMKLFADVDAIPLVIDTQDSAEIIKFVRQVAPSFAGINLEDIAAPRCFEIEDALQNIGIPVFHDDQHGTAIVVVAALKNAAKVIDKPYDQLRVAVVGAGAAGIAITRMLRGLDCSTGSCQLANVAHRVADVIVLDSKGAVSPDRADLNIYKQALLSYTNLEKRSGDLETVIEGFDAVVGVSRPGTISTEAVKRMGQDPIVFSMANPDPEILPEAAVAAGARIVATGRSDYPNQINNVLAFPGIFRAVLDGRLTRITPELQHRAVDVLAGMFENPTETQLLPAAFTPELAQRLAQGILAQGEERNQ